MLRYSLEWPSIGVVESKSYVCWNCGLSLASDKGWIGRNTGNTQIILAHIVVCHHCAIPTFLVANGEQYPGIPSSGEVHDITDESVKALYDEARRATQVGSYTAAVLCCRKLLMHIAVAKGAKGNESFQYYAQFLLDEHYVPPDAAPWVAHIKDKGNEANHEIVVSGKDEAREILSFVEMLLKLVFEFPATMRRRTQGEPTK